MLKHNNVWEYGEGCCRHVFLVIYNPSPRANGAKRRSGRKPRARVTNSARLFTPGEKDSVSGLKSGCHRRVGGHLTDLKNMDVY